MIRTSKVFLAPVVSLAFLATACGGDDDGDGGDNTDGISFVDSGAGTPDGPVAVTCPIEDDLGTIASLSSPNGLVADMQEMPPEGGPENAQVYFAFGSVGNEDFFELGLWEGYGPFAGTTAAAGTYNIEGDETAYLLCGVCAVLYGNVDAEGNAEKVYIATGGSITVDSVDATGMAGNGTGLTFAEIDLESETGTALPGGCTVSVPSITFDVAAPPPM